MKKMFGLNIGIPLSWTSPFRITEEGLGWNYVGDYLNREKPKDGKEKKCSTFKIWNTSFAKNTYKSRPLGENEMNPEEIFQYLIITNDVWIEFINLNDCTWTVHVEANLSDLEVKYLKCKK